MSGHSQFKNIMYRKGAQDAKRAKRFAKLLREVTVAARQGLPDPDANPRLRNAIAAARSQNVPKDNIDRILKRAAGGEDDTNYEEVRYEGYGPGGVAVIVEALTDNRNRTASAVRSYLTKNGGALGESGSVAFMFDRIGQITYKPDAGSADAVLEAAIEAGADDVQSGADGHVITCAFTDLGDVAKKLETALGEAETVKAVWKPQTATGLDEDKAAQMMRLLDTLEDDDDVQDVYSNFEVADDVLARLTAA
jgi:YebC/PmpR family DNA-binding regulatory protein